MSNWEIILKYHNHEFVIWFKEIASASGFPAAHYHHLRHLPIPLLILGLQGQ